MTSKWAGLCEESRSGILLPNPHRKQGYVTPAPAGNARLLHRSLPGYAPTPLRPLTGVAARLGVGAVWLKDEAGRLGLPSWRRSVRARRWPWAAAPAWCRTGP